MLHKNLLNLSFALLLILLFTNCSNPSPVSNEEIKTEIEIEPNRIIFKNFDEFNNLINKLENLNIDELESWIIENNKNSLYFSLKEDQDTDSKNNFLNNLPNSYKAVFNENFEIIISDKIVLLNKGKLFSFEIENYTSSTQLDLDNMEPVGNIQISFLDSEEADNRLMRTNIGQNQLEARYQYEFNGNYYYDCSGNYRYTGARLKYVHELMTVQTTFGYAAYSKLYLRVKLEWRGRRRWKAAGEPRDFTVNINLTGTYLAFNNGLVIDTFGSNSYYQTFTCSGDQTILLKSSDSYGLQGGAPIWSVETSGSISHKLHNSSITNWSHYFDY